MERFRPHAMLWLTIDAHIAIWYPAVRDKRCRKQGGERGEQFTRTILNPANRSLELLAPRSKHVWCVLGD